ncbi:MAG TPA: heterodisulfide reductase-related iron-sulfur binding cluster [Streptosporangiaceae bacterium]|jgi:glycolate oxidase iron-sulfur subunit|nr:heterodisulfide reductase-related iron-sulfur binding cluster [Streptosporangiaceae bacterium]
MTDPTGELRGIVNDCVHCGFCLTACPTYELWGEEMDSPRGRIHLISQLLDGAEASPAAASHLDRCLGCMACVPACPSGVRYDRLIEAARTWATDAEAAQPVTSLPPRSARQRALRAAIFATFPYPGRLKMMIGPLRAAQRAGADRLLRGRLTERLAPEVAAALRVAPSRPARKEPRGRMPGFVAAKGERRAVVGMLTGCVQQVFFPHVNRATARVLVQEGCDVLIPASQGCCGALSLHDGRRAEAQAFARRLIESFERAGVDAIIVNSAGCGSAMKEYADLLRDDPAWAERATALAARVADFSQFLARIGPAATRHPLDLTAAYHDACHLASAQRITAQPRELLAGIPDLVVAEVPDAGICCGSAGIYNLVQPEAAQQLGERKAASVASTGADLVVSGNPGCALQIASALATAGRPIPVAHLAEVLDASISGLPPSSLL